jgi:hypothetical protein
MTILLAQKLIVSLSVEVFLGAGGFALVQPDDVVFLSHFVTVDGTEGRGEAAQSREVEDGGVLDALIGFAGEGGANLAVDDAGAAIG